MLLKYLSKIRYQVSIRQRIKQQRQTRLGKVNMGQILPLKTSDQLQKIRNIGIIAHIDAGKTTSTQRMLYYAGALPSPGQIDQGTTTMDYMKQERQRGITIRSAAITFNWRDHHINLIDTPGHVDFSAQVTRSLQVLDGVVTILDAVKGVQAQTIKVWDQANKKKLPKICFLNKMDRIGSSIMLSAESMKKRLKVQPLLLQYPIGDGDTFKGMIDLITMQKIGFKGVYGEITEYKQIARNDSKYQLYQAERMKLIQQVGSFDQQIGQMCLNQQFISVQKLKLAIRRVLLNKQLVDKVCPVFIGTAYRNKGLQPLMNGIIQYLPSPGQRDPIQNSIDLNMIRKPSKEQPFTGFVFKMIYDLQRGPLAYTRVYSGVLRKGIQIMNSSKSIPQKINQILRVRANQYVPVQEVTAGDIVAITGFKEVRAGDTIINMNDPNFVLENIHIPNPVFVAPFQLQSNKYQRQFQQAMQKINIQDDSITYKNQIETGQFLVNGLGQLHLQILKDRLISDGIPVKMGNLKINYKQTVSKIVQKYHRIFREVKPGVQEEFQIQIELRPNIVQVTNQNQNNDGGQVLIPQNKILFSFERETIFDDYWNQFIRRKGISMKSRQKQSYDTVEQIQAARLQEEKNAALAANSNIPRTKKGLRNPTPMIPQQSQQGQQEDEPYYHISTLPFETLYELVENCKISLTYGKHNLPVMGVQLHILDGRYKRESFTKPIMNQCSQKCIRQAIQQVSILLQPIMQVNLKGLPQMIDFAVKDILKKRGRVQQQGQDQCKGFVPAQGMKGWVKQLRSMGFQVDMKFSGYEQVQGINPLKLLQENI